MISFHSEYYDTSETFHGFLPRIMGTRLDMVVTGCGKALIQPVWHSIVAELERLDHMLNRFDGNSELSRINREAVKHPVRVSEEMWHVLTDCKQYQPLTFGLFDITLNDLSKVVFDEESRAVAFPTEGFYFDLGGYAKGYAMEKIKHILTENGVKNAFIDFGNSSIAALGHHPYGDCWLVSIENPYKKGDILGEVKLRDRDLSTSGNTPAYTGHIVHPHTGEYTDAKKLACVVTRNSVQAEVLSTTMMLATEEQREEITSRLTIDRVTIYHIE